MAVSIIDQEIVSLLFEILAAVQRQEQIEELRTIEREVNGIVGLIGQTFAQSQSNGYKLDQLARAVGPLPTAIQQLGHPMQSGEPVSLSSGSANSLVQAIWEYSDGIPFTTAFNWLAWAGEKAYQDMLTDGLVVTTQPFLRLFYNNLTQPAGFENVSPNAPLDWKTIAETDATPIAWVERQYAGYGWQPYFVFPTDTVYYPDPVNANALWVLRMTQAEFDLLKRYLYPTRLAVAPVWPGLANVTLSASQPLSNGLTLTGPLHGVILKITSGFENLPGFPFGSAISYKHLGGVTFVDDGGQYEYANAYGFTDSVVCPKQMAVASSAVIRTIPGLTGTAQSFTINA